MADRKAEIDLKRKKLEELRRSREQKKTESATKAVQYIQCVCIHIYVHVSY